jgi:hypothetical protein
MPFPTALVCDLNKRALHLICEHFEPRGNSDDPKSSTQMYRIPHYQRFYTWPLRFQQNFIESILKGYPIPSIMLSRIIENDEEYFMVEDGQQRLTTAYRFLHDEFCIKIDDVEVTYSQLPEDLRMRFRTYEFQTITCRARDLTLIRRIEMFQSTNDHKSLTDNDRFHSCMDLPMGQCIANVLSANREPIKKYFGSIGKGKTRGGLADFAGMCITISNDESACLTTSYYKNGEYMRTATNTEKIQPFLDAYFEVLDSNVGTRVTKPRHIYGKLSGIMGLAVHSYLFHEEIHPAIAWYIDKLISNKKYMPSTFKKLGAGDIRNCQSDSIKKRFDAIVAQHAADPQDTGSNNGEDSASDDE